MSDVINDLAKKAKESVAEGLPVDQWILTYNQNFAKLIIQECAAVADKTVIGSDIVGNAIKTHFGIE